MDKRDLLDRLAANGDERLLLGRVWDKYEQCRRRNIPVVTGFLSPAEQELVRRLMGALDVREGWLLWGGYDTAQRRQAHFLPDWQTGPDFEAVAALRATFYEPNSLTHRDVLGSLMGLGVTRESVGDILVAEQSVDVLVTEPVRRFLLDSWDSAGRVRLKVQPIGPTELQVPEEKVKLLRDTVSSLRLDSVLSVGFSQQGGGGRHLRQGAGELGGLAEAGPAGGAGRRADSPGSWQVRAGGSGESDEKGKGVYHRQALPLTAPSRLRISCCGSFCCGWLVWDILWTLRIFWTFCGRFTDIFRYMDSSDLGGKAGKYRMDQKKIDRINELAKKARTPEGLTPEETQERAALRREYIDTVVGNLARELDTTWVVDENGNKRKLRKRGEENNHD